MIKPIFTFLTLLRWPKEKGAKRRNCNLSMFISIVSVFVFAFVLPIKYTSFTLPIDSETLSKCSSILSKLESTEANVLLSIQTRRCCIQNWRAICWDDETKVNLFCKRTEIEWNPLEMLHCDEICHHLCSLRPAVSVQHGMNHSFMLVLAKYYLHKSSIALPLHSIASLTSRLNCTQLKTNTNWIRSRENVCVKHFCCRHNEKAFKSANFDKRNQAERNFIFALSIINVDFIFW